MSITTGSGGPFVAPPGNPPPLQVTPGVSGPLTPKAMATNVALINGTQDLASWTTPNDGQQHPFLLSVHVSVAAGGETGGAITFNYTVGASAKAPAVVAGGAAQGEYIVTVAGLADPNTVVKIRQNSAMTVGTTVAVLATVLGI
jgi:hypothetical protein